MAFFVGAAPGGQGTKTWQMKIAYQGEPGAFSEAAARRLPPKRARALQELRGRVRRRGGRAGGYGVLPIENSIGGSIHRNFDLLLEHELPIVGEVEMPVVHQLLALPGTHARPMSGGSIRIRRRSRSATGSCAR